MKYVKFKNRNSTTITRSPKNGESIGDISPTVVTILAPEKSEKTRKKKIPEGFVKSTRIKAAPGAWFGFGNAQSGNSERK